VVFRHHTAETHRPTPRRHPLVARPCTAFVLALVMSSAAAACAGNRTGKDLPAGTVVDVRGGVQPVPAVAGSIVLAYNVDR
jgi:hypothetical protein